MRWQCSFAAGWLIGEPISHVMSVRLKANSPSRREALTDCRLSACDWLLRLKTGGVHNCQLGRSGYERRGAAGNAEQRRKRGRQHWREGDTPHVGLETAKERRNTLSDSPLWYAAFM